MKNVPFSVGYFFSTVEMTVHKRSTGTNLEKQLSDMCMSSLLEIGVWAAMETDSKGVKAKGIWGASGAKGVP